jgi:Uma2 family endonuclease
VTELAPARWSWTVDSYEQAAAAGVFGDEPRVELLDGEVYRVSPMRPGHATTCRRIHRLLGRTLDPDQWTVGGEQPVNLGARSQPEPDVWVARGPESRYDRRHPTADDLVLVVEVSDSSLVVDRSVKVPMYARAGVPEVWIVSVPERAVHVHTQPDNRTGRFGTVRTFESGDRVATATVGLEIPVGDVLPAPH